MKIDVLGMQAFVTVATLRSFARAADMLSVTSPALTRRLNNLEAQLGVQLLERTTRSVALTASGAGFLPRARYLLDELSTTFREISAGGQAQRGTVTIACVPTVGVQFLPSLLREYSRRLPDNRIHILDHTSYGVAKAVQQREAEFGISIADVQFSDLDSTHVLSRFVVRLRCRGARAGHVQQYLFEEIVHLRQHLRAVVRQVGDDVVPALDVVARELAASAATRSRRVRPVSLMLGAYWTPSTG